MCDYYMTLKDAYDILNEMLNKYPAAFTERETEALTIAIKELQSKEVMNNDEQI